MSRNASSSVGFSGDVPADLKCGFCKKPIQGEFYRTLNRFCCSTCVAQVKTILERNVVTPAIFARAAGAGLLAGTACAAAWAAIVQITHFEIGIIASFIGVAVGKAIYFASGKRRAAILQWLAVVLALVGMIGGKLALVSWQIADALRGQGDAVTPGLVIDNLMYLAHKTPSAIFGPFDLVWIAIAVYAAWRLCKAPVINIAGPYPFAPVDAGGLQFHTIEPAAPPAASEQP